MTKLAWAYCLVVVVVVVLMLNEINGFQTFKDQGTAINDDYIVHLRHLLIEIVHNAKVTKCLAIITDDVHHRVYDKSFFMQSLSRLYLHLYLKVENSEDLHTPSNRTVKILEAIKSTNCDVQVVTILNGVQMKSLLIYLERHLLIQPSQKVIFLHDRRLLEVDMMHMWESFVSNILIKRIEDSLSFKIITVPSPMLSNNFVVVHNLKRWIMGKSLIPINLFPDKTRDLNGITLPIVVVEHIPMVQQETTNMSLYHGLEVEIVKALGKVMNFKPKFYESIDSKEERWGKRLPNGNFTGLIGEMTKRKAVLAIGDLHYNELHSSVMDLSEPHSQECLTFLTTESLQDNTWKTLVLPFTGDMWIGVLLSLFMVGIVFYLMSWIHYMNIRNTTPSVPTPRFFSFFRKKVPFDTKRFQDVNFRASLSRYSASDKLTSRDDIFDTFSNCILLTCSMLFYVSLPKMPRNWPLRVLTGWYWIYCILLGVAYKASFTANLANPASRITIDTIEELAKSESVPGVWGEENKKFFDQAFDHLAQEIGGKIQIVEDIYSVTDLIAAGDYTYYDSEYFLRYLRKLGTQRRDDDKVLHIMRECIITMPIALGLRKNLPLKPIINKNINRLQEGGLISKWLRDALVNISAEEASPQEALMDMNKFWSSLIVLAIGCIFGLFSLFYEILHFKYVVQKHPLYDKYNTRIYYNFKRRFTNS